MRTRAAIALFILLCAPLLVKATPITYLVTVDTSTIVGTLGTLDFILLAGGDAQDATATISGLSPTAGLSGVPVLTDDAHGALPGPVVLGNTGALNRYQQSYTFGAMLTFLLAFDGPALAAPNGTATSGSTFSFGAIGLDGVSLLPADEFDNAFTVEVNTDGTTTPILPPSSAASLDAVPEPAAELLMGCALLGLTLLRRRIGRVK